MKVKKKRWLRGDINVIDLRVPSPIILPSAPEDARLERPIEIRLSRRRAPERGVTRMVLTRGGNLHCSILLRQPARFFA